MEGNRICQRIITKTSAQSLIEKHHQLGSNREIQYGNYIRTNDGYQNNIVPQQGRYGVGKGGSPDSKSVAPFISQICLYWECSEDLSSSNLRDVNWTTANVLQKHKASIGVFGC